MDYLRMPDVLAQFLQSSGAETETNGNAWRLTPHGTC